MEAHSHLFRSKKVDWLPMLADLLLAVSAKIVKGVCHDNPLYPYIVKVEHGAVVSAAGSRLRVQGLGGAEVRQRLTQNFRIRDVDHVYDTRRHITRIKDINHVNDPMHRSRLGSCQIQDIDHVYGPRRHTTRPGGGKLDISHFRCIIMWVDRRGKRCAGYMMHDTLYMMHEGYVMHEGLDGYRMHDT